MLPPVTVLVLISSTALVALAAAWLLWLRVLRPRVVLWHVRRRYGAVAAWFVRTTGLHHRR